MTALLRDPFPAIRPLARLAGALALVAALAACMGTEVAEAPSAAVEATGAPVGAGIAVPPGSYEDFIVNVGRRIYFAEGSAELDDVAKTTLRNQAEWLQRYADYHVKIQGFADDPGSAEQNRALGLRRAEAARTYLAAMGVPTSRMRTKTYGSAKERLTNDCDDRSCRAQNRRVHTVLEREAGV
ncbi:MAG TPA: OmpA family protein [Microvirga sp.]|jgi:peptidoglycan-associated lipoprotein|nr:OmpA family protein [Microvirga sp.]